MPKWLNNLLETATFQVLIPAFILLFILFALVWVLWTAQKRDDFDTAEFLKDDKGRYSALRAWGFVCLGVHSWWVSTLVFQSRDNENHFLYYGLIWASTPVLVRLADRWAGNLPFAQAGITPADDRPSAAPVPLAGKD